MAKYRYRGPVIDAFKYDGDLMGSDGNYYVPDWAAELFEDGVLYYSSFVNGPPCDLFLSGAYPIHVLVGDYIIKGVDGNIGVYNMDFFEANYEEIKGEQH